MTSSPRYRALTAADVARLPSPCRPGARTSPEAAWVHAAMRVYGLCGMGAYDGDVLAAHALVAAGHHLPGGHPRAGVGDAETAVILGASVPAVGDARKGLVQALAARLPVRHLEAVSGAGEREHGPGLVDAAWLADCGFHLHAASPSHRVWRLDQATTVRWRKIGTDALRQLGDLVPRPVAPPEPASRAPQQR